MTVLAAAGTIGASSQADAYYGGYYDPSYYRAEPEYRPQRPKVRRQQVKKNAVPEKETAAKPQGPLIINVSIQQQKVRVYDSNGVFAESPVSTGMPGHSTPMGIFSIIQKHKFHHSNIYSGAPMPYMQRITWSGVAMHAGVLPGYPASHGCIRMPMAFAMKMWNWTKMGARVIVTPGEITPAHFSHPLLIAQKMVPPVALEAPKVDAPLGVKSDKGADAGTAAKPAIEIKTAEVTPEALDLRSSVGHVEPRKPTQTADASGVMPVTMSDASPTAAPLPDTAAKSDPVPGTEAKPEAKSDTDTAPAKSVDAAPETQADIATGAVVKSDDKPAETKVAAPAAEAPAVTEPKATDVKAGEPNAVEAKPTETKATETKAPETKPAESKAAEKPAEPAKAADAPAAATDAKKDVAKDTARLPGVAKAEPPKRTGQIAVFISRKDSKLYVRQNFAPLLETPVTIAASDRPLGTHLFTAEADSTDANLLRWSVVTMPPGRSARAADDERPSRKRKNAPAPVEAKAQPVPNSPAEALDRITVPTDAMARIAEAMTTGASIIVSDQGINQGETGEGTDFIVSLR